MRSLNFWRGFNLSFRIFPADIHIVMSHHGLYRLDLQGQTGAANSVTTFARSKVSVGSWSEEEAQVLAENAFAELLTSGQETEGNFLYSLVDDLAEKNLGSIWFAQESFSGDIFLYDLVIHENLRGQGIGFVALQLLECKALQLNAQKISLHAFADNVGAIHLYEKFGFKLTSRTTTDVDMVKHICSG